MTREEFNTRIDEYIGKMESSDLHRCQCNDGLRDFLWRLAEDHKKIYDDDVDDHWMVDTEDEDS